MVRALVSLFLLVGLSACSTYAADRYAVSVDNVVAIKNTAAANPGRTVTVGQFTAAPNESLTEFDCRLVGPVKTPDGQPFEAYIRKALIDELRLAEVYAERSTTTIKGHLQNVEFNSFDGLWTLVLDVSSSNGTSFTVAESFDYDTSFVADAACNQGAQALMPAVQNLIRQIVTHPEFSALIGAA